MYCFLYDRKTLFKKNYKKYIVGILCFIKIDAHIYS